MIGQDEIKGKWKEVSGDIRSTWGKITGDELEENRGNLKAIAGLIQQRYGMAKDEAEQKLTSIYQRYEKKAEGPIERVKSKIHDSVENAKAKLHH